MSSFNRATLIGRVAKDPAIRSMNSGDRVANLSVATSEKWTDKSTGEKKEITDWHNVVVWNDGLVGVIERFVKKGDLIHVEGQIKTRKYTDQSGVEKFTTEIVLQKFGGVLTMLGSPRGNGEGRDDRQEAYGGSGGYGGGNSYGAARSGSANGGRVDNSHKPRESFPADLDDEIPFGFSESVW